MKLKEKREFFIFLKPTANTMPFSLINLYKKVERNHQINIESFNLLKIKTLNSLKT